MSVIPDIVAAVDDHATAITSKLPVVVLKAAVAWVVTEPDVPPEEELTKVIAAHAPLDQSIKDMNRISFFILWRTRLNSVVSNT